MTGKATNPPIEILLVEDNPADARLTKEGFHEAKITNALHVVEDGEQALDFLYMRNGFAEKPRPHLILLDLNLPGIDGRTVLETIKGDEDLRAIPVVVLTSSEAETDIVKSYQSHANCYISKPIEFSRFLEVISSIGHFWFSVVKVPSCEQLVRGSQ